jgi:hypothetical protein
MVLQPYLTRGKCVKVLKGEPMKENISEKNEVETKKADLIDWLLAIDTSWT